MPTAETPVLKKVCQDETGILYLTPYNGRLYLGADLNLTGLKLSSYKHWKKVLKSLEAYLIDRGIREYYALVSSLPRFRFAEFMGFKTNFEVLTGTQIEIVRKELF